MIGVAFNTVIYNPLYNGLIFLISVIPYADVGVSVIILTLLVKVALFPLAHRASHMQIRMRDLAPKIDKLKEKYKDDKQKQTLEIMALYKEYDVRPFLSILVIFIQLPIIIGLYWVFYKGGLPTIKLDLLYSFIHAPTIVSMKFLWINNLGNRSIIMALLAGLTQFGYSAYALPKPKPRDENSTMKDDLARSFHLQMKYVMPIIVVGIAWSISAAIALYWTTSNLFAIAQEMVVRKKIQKAEEKLIASKQHETGTN